MDKDNKLVTLIKFRSKLNIEMMRCEVEIADYLYKKLGFDRDDVIYNIYITNNPTGELLINGEYYDEDGYVDIETHYYPIEDTNEYVGIDYLKK